MTSDKRHTLENRSSAHNSAPAGPTRFMDRPRINHLLKQAMLQPVATIIAGAGYGKSHAVYSFLRKREDIITWIQLSEQDNSCERFWDNFVSAVEAGNIEAAARFRECNFPTTIRQFESYLRIPEKIVGEVTCKIVFVFDDFHVLHNSDVLTFIQRSIDVQFPNVTTLFLSRSEIPLDLAHLEFEGKIARLTEQELLFDETEIREYLTFNRLNPKPEVVSAIYHDTGGWAFAVHLAARSMRRQIRDMPYVPHAMRANIGKLIEREILSKVSPGLRKFLIQLSLVEQLPAEFVTGLKGSKAFIDESRRIGSFIRLTPHSNSYRIHNLIVEYLTRLQDELTEAEKKNVWRLMARWFSDNNQQMSALIYYEKAGDYDAISDIFYNILPLIIPVKLAETLYAIMRRVPRDLFENNIRFYVVYGRICINLSMFGEAEKVFSHIIAALESPGEICQNKDHARLLLACYVNLGFQDLLTCNNATEYKFVNYFEKAKIYSEISGYVVKNQMCVANIATYIIRVSSAAPGRMEAFITALRQAVPNIAVAMNGCYWGGVEAAEAELAYYRNELVRAEEMTLKAIKKAREKRQYEIESRSLGLLWRVNIHKGDTEAIEKILVRFDQLLTEPEYLNRFTHYDIYVGTFYAHIGRPEKIPVWMKNEFEDLDINPLAYGLEVATKAKCHMAVNEYATALATIEGRDVQYGPNAFVLGRVVSQVIEAVCRYKLKEKEAAYAALQEAYELAAPNRFWMPFIEMGRDMRALINCALKNEATRIPVATLEKLRDDCTVYAKKLAAIAKFFAPKKSRSRPPGDALAPREPRVAEMRINNFRAS